MPCHTLPCPSDTADMPHYPIRTACCPLRTFSVLLHMRPWHHHIPSSQTRTLPEPFRCRHSLCHCSQRHPHCTCLRNHCSRPHQNCSPECPNWHLPAFYPTYPASPACPSGQDPDFQPHHQRFPHSCRPFRCSRRPFPHSCLQPLRSLLQFIHSPR